MKVPLARPDITDLERQYVLRVLESPFLSLGPELPAFEEELASQAGVPFAVATNSGTSALHLATAALDLGPEDEVITTPFSFIASANCILFQGAQPVFADIDPFTLALDPDRAEECITPKTKAILAVDVFGHPAPWDRLEALAARYNLALIEDAAEAIGSKYQGRSAGSFGDAAIFAFYPNKQITTGEGGVLLTKDPDLARIARSLRNQGRSEGNGWLHHERLGYNYRLSDIHCALGRAQLQRLPEILASRERVASHYQQALADLPEIERPSVAENISMSWFVYVVRLASGYTAAHRDRLLQLLRDQGIECGNYFPCIHLEPFYRSRFGYREGDYPIAEEISGRTVALPFHGGLGGDEIEYVVSGLKRALASL